MPVLFGCVSYKTSRMVSISVLLPNNVLLLSVAVLSWLLLEADYACSQVMPVQPAGHGHNPMHDKAHVQDRAHLKEHLEGISDKKPEDMSEQELQFHYFKLHDTDGNNKLDGLELVHAITHYHGEMPGTDGNRVLGDTELAMTIDAILKDDDKDGDGYIDYTEFATRQN